MLTLKVPEKLQLYGLYVYYVVHICDFGMLRVNVSVGNPLDLSFLARDFLLCLFCCFTRVWALSNLFKLYKWTKKKYLVENHDAFKNKILWKILLQEIKYLSHLLTNLKVTQLHRIQSTSASEGLCFLHHVHFKQPQQDTWKSYHLELTWFHWELEGNWKLK